MQKKVQHTKNERGNRASAVLLMLQNYERFQKCNLILFIFHYKIHPKIDFSDFSNFKDF